MKLAAHQPNLIPWMPLIHKIAASDVFVLMGHCQFEKNGFQNRFRLRVGSPWHTMSVRHGKEPIIRKKYVRPKEDWDKIKFSLLEYPILNEFDPFIKESLWETNVGIILKIVELLKIKTPIHFDWQTQLRGTERLAAICKEFNADTYLGGSSTSKYMEPEVFRAAGIKIEQQTYGDKRHVLEVLK